MQYEIEEFSDERIALLEGVLTQWTPASFQDPALTNVLKVLRFYITALKHTQKLDHPIEAGSFVGMVAPEATGEWLGQAFSELFGRVFPCSDGFRDRFAAQTGLVYHPEWAKVDMEALREALDKRERENRFIQRDNKSLRDRIAHARKGARDLQASHQQEVERLKTTIKELEW